MLYLTIWITGIFLFWLITFVRGYQYKKLDRLKKPKTFISVTLVSLIWPVFILSAIALIIDEGKDLVKLIVTGSEY